MKLYLHEYFILVTGQCFLLQKILHKAFDKNENLNKHKNLVYWSHFSSVIWDSLLFLAGLLKVTLHYLDSIKNTHIHVKKELLAGSKTKSKYWPISSITFADQHIACHLQMCRAYRKHVVHKSVVADNFPLFKKGKSVLLSKDSLHADTR